MECAVVMICWLSLAGVWPHEFFSAWQLTPGDEHSFLAPMNLDACFACAEENSPDYAGCRLYDDEQ